MPINAEVEIYKKNRINELIAKYNSNKNSYLLSYNAAYSGIVNSRDSSIVKNSKIISLNNMYTNIISQLNLLYNSNVAKINSFKVNKIQATNKKALLIGINNYAGKNKLAGCINDVNNIQDKLLTMGYNKNNIKTVLNENATGKNIISSLTNLLVNSVSGDLLFFSYSGHGSYELDKSGDEKTTNCDQDIVSVDLQIISDDVLKNIIKTNLKPGVTLFALFDSCYSGSILDLRYQYMDSLNGENYSENMKEDETDGDVIMISGCNDMQTSADAIINNVDRGATTWAFLKSITDVSNKLTWRQLITSMRSNLKSGGFSQIPQISSGNIMELDAQVFI